MNRLFFSVQLRQKRLSKLCPAQNYVIFDNYTDNEIRAQYRFERLTVSYSTSNFVFFLVGNTMVNLQVSYPDPQTSSICFEQCCFMQLSH